VVYLEEEDGKGERRESAVEMSASLLSCAKAAKAMDSDGSM